MRQTRLVLLALALLGVSAGPGPVRADAGPATTPALGVSIDDFNYLDTSGEVTDQAAVHEKRLEEFMQGLRADVAAEPRYRLVAPGEARIRIVGGVQKMSTLIGWVKVALVDTVANRLVFERRYSFRGDSDQAWDRARIFVSRDVLAALAEAQPPAKTDAAAQIALAVFEFELDDTSAAAQASGPTPADATDLANVTKGVRELLAQSGRYHLIDPGRADGDAIKHQALRDCGGCDAAIAQKLGADQSLVGVVRRVSRTEYTVAFQLRDARSGAVVSRGDSGLRMGADYSWTRGAVRLVGDRLLDNGAHK
ncbi:DUF2380 domain-containing protein [Bradyrhizobium jicamae]|uniref:DUF2380 domain-containing protein n=1 Tax=Bradyrhizobium jicamae TaxID=280332 RepID=A0ABS5FQX5_9BRAD|nr:DUF3280 domain-containing protein [Bradyrhizobium jicamae]MBR0799150.1 DUF2380 domain-containing protein [Bradyrhizobium jicamae]